MAYVKNKNFIQNFGLLIYLKFKMQRVLRKGEAYWTLVMGIGSCHSGGVGVGLSGYRMCQMHGPIRRTIFLKMRTVGCIVFIVPRLIFSKSKSSRTCSLVPRGKFLLAGCRPFLEHKFVLAPLISTLVYALFKFTFKN